MAFPIIAKEDWDLVENDDLWIDMKSDGTQRYAGKSFLYAKKDNKNSNLKNFLFECDIYGRGVIVMTWALYEIKGNATIQMCHISKILKNGNWITGIQNQTVVFYPLRDETIRKVCGWKLKLQTGPNIFTEVDVRKDGGAADDRK